MHRHPPHPQDRIRAPRASVDSELGEDIPVGYGICIIASQLVNKLLSRNCLKTQLIVGVSSQFRILSSIMVWFLKVAVFLRKS